MFAGIDISHSRGCAWAVLDPNYRSVAAGWVGPHQNIERTANELASKLRKLGPTQHLAVGIDAPRQPLERPRLFRWQGKYWKRSSAPLAGRHCEVVISTLRLANPQWSPLLNAAPLWMQLGFTIFARLAQEFRTFEVFPSASYRMLQDVDEPSIHINLNGFCPDPKDMLDAYIGALTVGEFLGGRGCEVGGGDNLGTILLPRPLPECSASLLKGPPHEDSTGSVTSSAL